MRTLGLDVGEKRIGVSLSDPKGILATSLSIIPRPKDETAIEAILVLAGQYEVERIVVGIPRSLDGRLGPQAERVQAFIQALSQNTDIPVDTWDEWLSTVAAERALAAAGVKSSRRKAKRDSIAAAIILQSYLDAKRPMISENEPA